MNKVNISSYLGQGAKKITIWIRFRKSVKSLYANIFKDFQPTEGTFEENKNIWKFFRKYFMILKIHF